MSRPKDPCWNELRRNEVVGVRGPASARFKGGRRKTKAGYVTLTGRYDHPNSSICGQIAEHTVVMSEHVGRPLLPGECVHHKNGVRDDNRIENLELWSKSQPPGQSVEDKVKWAKEILQQYAPSTVQTNSIWPIADVEYMLAG